MRAIRRFIITASAIAGAMLIVAQASAAGGTFPDEGLFAASQLTLPPATAYLLVGAPGRDGSGYEEAVLFGVGNRWVADHLNELYDLHSFTSFGHAGLPDFGTEECVEGTGSLHPL